MGAKLASALKALAWTSAQATDRDLKSSLRKSTSVWGLSLCTLFSQFSLFPLFLRLSVSFSLSSFFPHHHHHHLHLHFSLITVILPLHFAFSLFLFDFHLLRLISDQNISFSCSVHAIFMSSEPPVYPETIQNLRG